MKKSGIFAVVSIGAFLLISPVAYAQSPITESFDAYNAAPWSTFGGTPKNFDFTDGSGGECVAGGCIVANGNSSSIPRIYKDGGTALLTGAFTVGARAKQGTFSGPSTRISICQGPLSGCTGTRIDFTGVPLDDTWHQYLVMWRQGATVETCTIRDSLLAGACTWVASAVPAGSVFDGVALWSGNAFRTDLGSNLWFDELRPAVIVDLLSSAPPVVTTPLISLEAHFSDGVTGFDLADITVSNGSATNFTALTPDTYTFDVVPATDGAVHISVPPGAAQNAGGAPTVGAAPVVRTLDSTGPALTIVSTTTDALAPIMSGTVGETATVTVTIAGIAYVGETAGDAWSATVPEGALGNGSYTAVASAQDSLGNVSYATGTLTINRFVPDTTGPALTILNKTTNDLSPVMSGTVGETATVTVTIAGIAYVGETAGDAWSATVPEGALGDGSYTAVASAADTIGNISYATGTLAIDRTAPNLVITGGPAEGSVTNQSSVTLTFTSDAPVTCQIDDGAPEPCGGSFSATGLVSGTHVFIAESIDTVGNVARKTRTWSIDSAAPIVTEVLAVPTPTIDPTPDYIFNTTKAGAIGYGGSCSSAAATATVGDNTVTFTELLPGTYSDCAITVTDTLGNVSASRMVSPFTIAAPPPLEETVTLPAAADTYIRKGARNTNEGGSPIIRIRQGGDNRGLVRFDQAAIAAAVGGGTLLSASLEFTIEETKNNWGTQSREVAAHRMLMDWVEGNGKNGELPGNQSFRGTGTGATWECAKDTNINNQKADCADQDEWEMRLKRADDEDDHEEEHEHERPWALAKTDSIFLQKKQEGVVAFNVTADVAGFLSGASNYGWIVRKSEEEKGGYVTFFSKESAGAAPELILTIRR